MGMFPLLLVFLLLQITNAEEGPRKGETFVFHHKNKSRSLSVSSREFQAIAKSTFRKVLPCVTKAWIMENQQIDFKFPEDAEHHYHHLLNVTQQFRSQHWHYYAGYEGPWIENHFIARFLGQPLSYFRGFIPIFIQWVDHQASGHRNPLHRIRQVLRQELRRDVLYLTISQCDDGLVDLSKEHPNLFVLSAGGYGHVVVPLIKSEIKPIPLPPSFTVEIGFYGTVSPRTPRRMFLTAIQEAASKQQMSFREGLGETWMEDMSNTKFNLAPRGIGRTSFRFAETIQMGRIPVFVYDDIPWIPYEGSNASISSYGFVARLTRDHSINTIPEVVAAMKALTPEGYQQKLKKVEAVRHLFTYEGVMQEIEWFLQDPFGREGGHLTCTTFPRTYLCCG